MLQTISASDRVPEAPTCVEPQVRPRAVLAVLVVGTFLAPLDSSIVNIALPAISQQFGAQPAAVRWVATAYLVTSAALLLSMGRVGDLWGLRKLYVWGLLVFGGGSLACAFADGLPVLVGARVFQAVGASMLFAAGPALVAKTFPPNRRGWALGFISLAVSAGLTVGPSLGGILLGSFGWPSLFLINVPLSVIVAAIAWRLLPDECSRREPFDLGGAVLAGLSLLALLLALTQTESRALLSLPVAGGVAVSVALFAAFIAVERRHPHPMVDLALFKVPRFSYGIAAATLAYMALFSVTFNMPFYLLRVRGLDPSAAGLLLTATPLSMALFAPLAGRLSDRQGSRGLATGGLVALAVGLAGLSFVQGDTPLLLIPFGLTFLGSGMAFFQTPNTSSVLGATPRSHSGVGSAMIAEARNVGMAVGIAVTAAIVTAFLAGPLSGGVAGLPQSQADAFVRGMSAAMRFAAVVALIGAGLSWVKNEAPAVEAPRATP